MSADIHWFRGGKIEQEDSRLGEMPVLPAPIEAEPDMTEEEIEMRKSYCEIVRSLCDKYEAGEIDMMIGGFVDQAGRPIPMISPMPFHAITDALALADILHETVRGVVNYHLSPPTEASE